MENLILGTAWGYQVDQIKVFVESWKRYSNKHRLILLVEPDISTEKFNYLIESGVDVRFFTSGYFIPSAIHNTRYFKYLDILLEHRGQFNKVFLTDVRDVAFQGDIFEMNFPDNLCVFMEDPDWNLSERFNRQILINNYGVSIANQLSEKRIICSGTTLGTAEQIINYIVTLMNERGIDKMVQVGGIPDEQAPHNYILHNDLIPNHKVENGHGVATLCLVHPNEIELSKNELISVYGYSGTPIIHQWDRHPNLVEFLYKKYGIPTNTKSN